MGFSSRHRNRCFWARCYFLKPRSRAGRNRIARRIAKAASTVKPMSLRGSSANQINGNTIIASTATGQQSTNNKHQRRNEIRSFISNFIQVDCPDNSEDTVHASSASKVSLLRRRIQVESTNPDEPIRWPGSNRTTNNLSVGRTRRGIDLR